MHRPCTAVYTLFAYLDSIVQYIACLLSHEIATFLNQYVGCLNQLLAYDKKNLTTFIYPVNTPFDNPLQTELFHISMMSG